MNECIVSFPIVIVDVEKIDKTPFSQKLKTKNLLKIGLVLKSPEFWMERTLMQQLKLN